MFVIRVCRNLATPAGRSGACRFLSKQRDERSSSDFALCELSCSLRCVKKQLATTWRTVDVCTLPNQQWCSHHECGCGCRRLDVQNSGGNWIDSAPSWAPNCGGELQLKDGSNSIGWVSLNYSQLFRNYVHPFWTVLSSEDPLLNTSVSTYLV